MYTVNFMKPEADGNEPHCQLDASLPHADMASNTSQGDPLSDRVVRKYPYLSCNFMLRNYILCQV